MGQQQRVIDELVPRVESLAMLACSANMGFNIDAEEADRLDISLDVIEMILSNPALTRLGWFRYRGAGVWQTCGTGTRLALRAGTTTRSKNHGPAGKGRLLGY